MFFCAGLLLLVISPSPLRLILGGGQANSAHFSNMPCLTTLVALLLQKTTLLLFVITTASVAVRARFFMRPFVPCFKLEHGLH